MRIVTAAEMREVERRAITEYGIDERELMESAAMSMIRTMAKEIAPERIAVACGPGNNGGDGLAAARMLKEFGHDVEVILSIPPRALKGEPLTQYRRTVESGVKVVSPDDKDYERTLASEGAFDAILDCLLGTGAKGPPKGEVARLIEWIDSAQTYVLSADVPSGVECDSGRAHGVHVHAYRTVTFGLPKPFLFQCDGVLASGGWTVGDIGLPEELTESAGSALLLDKEWFFRTTPNRDRNANKRSAGVVLVVAGSDRFPGAAVLTARGAYRAGAGLVVVAGVESACAAVSSHLPECPLVRLSEANAVESVLEAVHEADAVCIGPGLGRSESVKKFLDEVLPRIDKPTVVDADALYFVAVGATLPKSCVLTPHEGEAARLLQTTAEEVRSNRFDAARSLAQKFSCTVLLKGQYTLIADHDLLYVCPKGNQILATGGTGDVLTGIIGALLSMGKPLADAAAFGAYWHGSAAESLIARFPGKFGALASDVANELPIAMTTELDAYVDEWIADDSKMDEDEQYDEFEDYDEEVFDERDN